MSNTKIILENVDEGTEIIVNGTTIDYAPGPGPAEPDPEIPPPPEGGKVYADHEEVFGFSAGEDRGEDVMKNIHASLQELRSTAGFITDYGFSLSKNPDTEGFMGQSNFTESGATDIEISTPEYQREKYGEDWLKEEMAAAGHQDGLFYAYPADAVRDHVLGTQNFVAGKEYFLTLWSKKGVYLVLSFTITELGVFSFGTVKSGAQHILHTNIPSS